MRLPDCSDMVFSPIVIFWVWKATDSLQSELLKTVDESTWRRFYSSTKHVTILLITTATNVVATTPAETIFLCSLSGQVCRWRRGLIHVGIIKLFAAL